MITNKAIIGPARRMFLAVVLTSCAPAVVAQAPRASNRDDLNVTMGVIANPDATEADEIVRKIPRSKPDRPGEGADAPAQDLADPNGTGGQETGAPIDTGTPADTGNPAGPGGSADPITPVLPDIPDVTSGPGPGGGPDLRDRVDDLGHQVAQDGRDRSEEAPHTRE